jgi:hypothetical protein
MQERLADAHNEASGLAKRLQLERDRWAQGGEGQGRAGQGRAGQGRAGQGRAGQGRAGQGRAGQGRAGQRFYGLQYLPASRPAGACCWRSYGVAVHSWQPASQSTQGCRSRASRTWTTKAHAVHQRPNASILQCDRCFLPARAACLSSSSGLRVRVRVRWVSVSLAGWLSWRACWRLSVRGSIAQSWTWPRVAAHWAQPNREIKHWRSRC